MKNIDKNAHYFAQMDLIDFVVPFYGIAITNGNKSWVECEIVEDEYKVDDGYKVTLRPLDSRFSSHSYYQYDFCSLLQNGLILKKTDEAQKVHYIEWEEPLTPTVNIVHSGYVVA